jgi:hypothetical protein
MAEIKSPQRFQLLGIRVDRGDCVTGGHKSRNCETTRIVHLREDTWQKSKILWESPERKSTSGIRIPEVRRSRGKKETCIWRTRDMKSRKHFQQASSWCIGVQDSNSSKGKESKVFWCLKLQKREG